MRHLLPSSRLLPSSWLALGSASMLLLLLLLLALATAAPVVWAQEAGATASTPAEPAPAEPEAAPEPERAAPAPEAESGDDPLDRVHLATCPCWTTTVQLLREIQFAHSEISFECFVTTGTFAVELSAYSGGTGGPYQSLAATPQPQPTAIPRCRHVQVQPRVEISSSGQIRTLGEVNACISILTDVAARLGCKN